MDANTIDSFIKGYERLGAWADVLDGINVFPVADGDTGRNLMVSLAPLKGLRSRALEETVQELLFAGRGNSGNIATRFVAELLRDGFQDSIYPAVKAGAENARKAVKNPRPGTMLTVLDRLARSLEGLPSRFDLEDRLEEVLDQIQYAVYESPEMLPELRASGVVDAGALGMLLFLEGLLKGLCNRDDQFRAIRDIFGDRLEISDEGEKTPEASFCVDFVVRMTADVERSLIEITGAEQSASLYRFQDCLKIHLHTSDTQSLKQKVESMGTILQWQEDDLFDQVKRFHLPVLQSPIHIVTDAAGSITRDMAQRLGVTLLESYVTLGRDCIPETSVIPEVLYRAMRDGGKASTSQASVFERYQHYDRLVKQYENVLYLCVGSAYTGNYVVAAEWKKQYDPEDRLTLIDTGAASGRLAAAVIATAKYAVRAENRRQVIGFAQQAAIKSGEYIFLDELKYLAAGGRMSKTGAFFGDMLNIKPVVSPEAGGVEKVGIVRTTEAQINFALDKLGKSVKDEAGSLVILEYSDNRQWVQGRCITEIKKIFKRAEILVQPLSLTAGVHIGPGAWAVAFYGNPPASADGDPGDE